MSLDDHKHVYLYVADVDELERRNAVTWLFCQLLDDGAILVNQQATSNGVHYVLQVGEAGQKLIKEHC